MVNDETETDESGDRHSEPEEQISYHPDIADATEEFGSPST